MTKRKSWFGYVELCLCSCLTFSLTFPSCFSLGSGCYFALVGTFWTWEVGYTIYSGWNGLIQEHCCYLPVFFFFLKTTNKTQCLDFKHERRLWLDTYMKQNSMWGGFKMKYVVYVDILGHNIKQYIYCTFCFWSYEYLWFCWMPSSVKNQWLQDCL